MTGQTRSAPDGQLVLKGGTIYASPTESPITNGVVVIRDGKIAAVGPRGSVRVPNGVATLDCSGLTVVAGLWNSHVHFFERKWADAAKIPAPKDWMPPERILKALGFMQFPVAEVTDAAGALAASKKILDSGTDGLKMFSAAPSPPFATLPGEAIRAAANEAHRRKKPVFAHPSSRDGLLAAVEGGVDVIAHTTPQSGPWDEGVLAAMRQAKVVLIPTLKVWKYLLRHDRISLGDLSAQTSTGQLRAWLASGGVILFGTDVGGMDDYDPSDEYALMAEAGMTFRQIVASLTTAPADKFGESARLGRIAPGYAADLVVLNADPSQDVRAFAAVRNTIRDGKLIYQATR